MEYRVENKYLVTDLEIAALSQRLKAVMQPDIHQQGGCYEIRSVYFDDIYDSGIQENESGVDCRRKYRIRCYGPDPSPVNLEIKEKRNALTKKTACPLTPEVYTALLEDPRRLPFGEKAPLNELLLQVRCRELRPRILIAYERTAFVHPVGNVRITFDRNIMASTACEAFRKERIPGLIPVLPVGLHVLEVKYDELLPDTVAKQLETGKLRQTTLSKYYLGRCAVIGMLH